MPRFFAGSYAYVVGEILHIWDFEVNSTFKANILMPCHKITGKSNKSGANILGHVQKDHTGYV